MGVYYTGDIKAMKNAHTIRVKEELSKAGISAYGLLKAEARYLPKIIQEDEHIMAAAYGRAEAGGAILVATDRRIVFLDKKPLIVTSDEISYEVVSGVGVGRESGLFASLTLHTRMGDYTVRFVSPPAAKKFEQYLMKMRLEGAPRPDSRRTKPVNPTPDTAQLAPLPSVVDVKSAVFLENHDIGVLSTIGRTGQLHGSPVYYVYDRSLNLLYLLTKSDTTKAHNILATHNVAFTAYDEAARQMVQITGQAEIEADPAQRMTVFEQISAPKDYNGESHHPPVTKIQAGSFIVFKIIPTDMIFSEFK